MPTVRYTNGKPTISLLAELTMHEMDALVARPQSPPISETANVKGQRQVVVVEYQSPRVYFKIPDGLDLEDKTVVKRWAMIGTGIDEVILAIYYADGRETEKIKAISYPRRCETYRDATLEYTDETPLWDANIYNDSDSEDESEEDLTRFCVDCEKDFQEDPENSKEGWVSTKCVPCSRPLSVEPDGTGGWQATS